MPLKLRFGVYVIVPSTANVTVPPAGCVTLVTALPLLAKVSAVAPLVPVITLKDSGVSSIAAMVSLVISATGVTVIATVPEVVTDPSNVATVRLIGAAGEPVL